MSSIIEKKKEIDLLYDEAKEEFMKLSFETALQTDFPSFLKSSPQGKVIFENMKLISQLLSKTNNKYPLLFVFRNYSDYFEQRYIVESYSPLTVNFSLDELIDSPVNEPIIISIYQKAIVVDNFFEAIGRLDDIVNMLE